MKKNKKTRAKKVGLAPGTLIHVGEVKTRQPDVHVMEYGQDFLQERDLDIARIAEYEPPKTGKVWFNVHGLHNAKLIGDIGAKFGLHPLVQEDILHTDQRPKVDAYDRYLYIVTRFFSFDQNQNALVSEQISLILGKGFVLSFQERPTGTFEPLRERLRNGRGHIRQAGADYLTYALLDVIVDGYFSTLEKIGDECEALEDLLLRNPCPDQLHELHRLKRENMELRHSIWPLRDVINELIRNDHDFFERETLIFLRDVYDHTIHLIESLEAIRDLLGGMLDIYLSSISNRVNMEVRTLTVVTMLFMPATLITGIFGMNFDVMPWVKDSQGFWWVIGLIVGLLSSMGLFFWRRQWLSRH